MCIEYSLATATATAIVVFIVSFDILFKVGNAHTSIEHTTESGARECTGRLGAAIKFYACTYHLQVGIFRQFAPWSGLDGAGRHKECRAKIMCNARHKGNLLHSFSFVFSSFHFLFLYLFLFSFHSSSRLISYLFFMHFQYLIQFTISR